MTNVEIISVIRFELLYLLSLVIDQSVISTLDRWLSVLETDKGSLRYEKPDFMTLLSSLCQQ